ncbi:MAG: adenosylmethionine decarboxylase [Candidatus Hodarchaeota archaeon]
MDAKAEEILAVVAERAKLAEGIEGIRSILLTMYRFPSLKNKKLAQKTEIAIPTIAAVRSELVKAGIIEKRNFLGEKGREWVKTRLDLKFDYDPLPGSFNSIIKEIPEEFSFLNDMQKIIQNRPTPEFALDQSHADFPTIIKKTLYLLKKGDIEGRRIIFLGDDDNISLSVGLTRLAKEITVLDIDKRILDYISEKAEEYSLQNFNIIRHDLRESCAKEIMNKYDVVVMDPPYTIQGLRLFLKRASQVLKSSIQINSKIYPIIGKKCLLSFGNKPPIEMQKLQLSILDHGFIIKQMIPDFNRYEGASIIGKFSHLFYLNSVINPHSKYNLSFSSRPIYTSEVKAKITPPFTPVGFHFFGEMRFDSQNLILNNEKIRRIFMDSLIASDLKILDIYNHDYIPYGYSIIAILETSHAALHTWPEHGYISIDIFICDEFEKGLNALRLLKNNFKPMESEFFYMERGKGGLIEYKTLKL